MSEERRKAREFWIPYGNHYNNAVAYESEQESKSRARFCHETVHVREVLPDELTPDEMIQRLLTAIDCSEEWHDSNIQKWIESNKDRIINGEKDK